MTMTLTVTSDGWLKAGEAWYRCAIGRSGIAADKREGDGATPAGRFPLRDVLYRPDRVDRPRTGLPVRALTETDGWCDDPGDPAYNRPVRLPYAARAEALWRRDGLYDVVVVIGYNDDPPIANWGSAVFLHVAAAGYTPTEGCVALGISDLLAVLAQLSPESAIVITEAPRGAGH